MEFRPHLLPCLGLLQLLRLLQMTVGASLSTLPQLLGDALQQKVLYGAQSILCRSFAGALHVLCRSFAGAQSGSLQVLCSCLQKLCRRSTQVLCRCLPSALQVLKTGAWQVPGAWQVLCRCFAGALQVLMRLEESSTRPTSFKATPSQQLAGLSPSAGSGRVHGFQH